MSKFCENVNWQSRVPMYYFCSASLAKHIVHVSSLILKKCPIDHFAVDKWIYAIGRIGYNEFTRLEGQLKRTAQIVPHTIFPCDDLDHPEYINELKLYGRVEQPPRIEDNVTKLIVSSEYFDQYVFYCTTDFPSTESEK